MTLACITSPHAQVVVAQPGMVVWLWDQYQAAPGLKRHLNLRGTWVPEQHRSDSGGNVKSSSLKLLQVPPRQPNLTGLHIRCLVEEVSHADIITVAGISEISVAAYIHAYIHTHPRMYYIFYTSMFMKSYSNKDKWTVRCILISTRI